MRVSVRYLLATPRFGALLALLIVGFAAPSGVKAGCSAHYLASQSRSDGMAAGLELLSQAGAIPAPEGDAPRERPTPCSGALCSGDPAPPFPTIPPVPSPGAGQWAIHAFPAPLAGPGSLAAVRAETNPRPVDQSCSIFHPPRLRDSSISS